MFELWATSCWLWFEAGLRDITTCRNQSWHSVKPSEWSRCSGMFPTRDDVTNKNNIRLILIEFMHLFISSIKYINENPPPPKKKLKSYNSSQWKKCMSEEVSKELSLSEHFFITSTIILVVNVRRMYLSHIKEESHILNEAGRINTNLRSKHFTSQVPSNILLSYFFIQCVTCFSSFNSFDCDTMMFCTRPNCSLNLKYALKLFSLIWNNPCKQSVTVDCVFLI